MEWLKPILSMSLALAVLLVLGGGLWNRVRGDFGIGWQFIRFTVLGISIPIVGLLALNDALFGEAATLIGTAMGFAFGKNGEKDKKVKNA